MGLFDRFREKQQEGKERREEHGQLGAIKMALSDGKEEIADEMEESGVTDTYEEAKEVGKRKFDDDPVSINCRECGGELETADVSRCPHCSYDPEAHKTWWYIHLAVIFVLWATIIGIPFSIIPYLKQRKHSKKRKQGVAVKKWE